MNRILMHDLVKWKASPRRKPLIIKGVRQVGKTWLLNEFGKTNYENVAYFNFEGNMALAKMFLKDFDTKRLISELSVLNEASISPEKTLIIFDEIQFCSEAITSLKYFCENAPEYHLVCAGSLLGIALARPTSYPVGKVDMLTLRPMSFYEFLLANSEEILVQYIDKEIKVKDSIEEVFANKLAHHLKTYFITGGMPEAVFSWIASKDIEALEQIQQNILNLYELDFAKYAPHNDIPKLSMIWNSIPNQLAKENGKFVYGLLKEGAGARAFENAMTWLQNAGMIYKVHKIEKPGMPLKAYVNNSYFKLYAPDIGLLRKMAGLSPKSVMEEDRLYQEFKGAMTENYVLAELISQTGEVPFYWTTGNLAEVDFVVQFEDKIVPIEVKASKSVRSKSLGIYRQKYQPEVALKVSMKDFECSNGLFNIPLYVFWKLKELLKEEPT